MQQILPGTSKTDPLAPLHPHDRHPKITSHFRPDSLSRAPPRSVPVPQTEISMHSYANGTSTKVKENNWDLIARFFVRTMPRIALDPGAIEGVMRGSPGFAVDMLEMLYTKFTLKKLSSMVPLMDDSSYGGPLDVSVQRDREVSLTGETSPGHRKPQTVTRGGTASAVKFQGIRTLPQETAAAARKRLAHGVTYEDAAAGIYTA